jgi:NADH-quinone oxidoreductase subunit M
LDFPILSSILIIPTIAVLLILFCKPEQKTAIRVISLIATGITLALALVLCFAYDKNQSGVQFYEFIPWVPQWGINYIMGVDGLSVPLVLLNAIAIFTGVMVSWSIQDRVKEYYALLIFLATGVFGVFMTQDLFFFAIFYEVAVLPMYLLIAIWGSGANKEYAAFKLTLVLFFGSAFVMAGILFLYKMAGINSFNIMELKKVAQFSTGTQSILFLLFFIGFGSIVPSFPLHTWSPEGHACAPSAVSMLHAGVLMKLGGYGLLRIAIPLLPEGLRDWALVMMVLSMCNIIYGAFTAIAQDDMKFMVGFSSVSHMGMVLFGISTMTLTGLNGAAFQMFAHGLVTALYFSSIGTMYNKTHTRSISDLGGIANVMPRSAFFFAIAALAGLGLPGFAPFVAELLVFIAGVKTYPLFGTIAVISVVVTAFYLIRCIKRVYFGKTNPKWEKLTDATNFEVVPLVILVIALFVVGMYPRLILDFMQLETRNIVAKFGMM